jgi:NAD(P)-dependent dehydrogenase (short-subunit alcohol dehydrogenase family)
VCLVTGAGRGIGKAIAVSLAAEGGRLAVTARTESELAETVDAIRSAGGDATAFPTDLSDRAQTLALVGRVAGAMGPVEVLVNNAGVGGSADPNPVQSFNDSFWDLTMEVNVTAPYLLCKAVLPSMLERKWGRIITVSSINATRPALHACAYTASKHGVLGLMRTLAVEVASLGITANTICPGPVKTRMNDARMRYDAGRLGRDLVEHEKGMTPIGGRLDPEDIAHMAVYLASDDSRMVTGQAFNLCGGIVIG